MLHLVQPFVEGRGQQQLIPSSPQGTTHVLAAA
jgi:hypothetical protein